MSITMTENATKKLGTLLEAEGNPNLKLRIFVSGGGCSGFQYGFTFDENQEEDDTAVTSDGVTVLVDKTSINYLKGAEVDYVEDLNGAQFVIKNPNAESSCGCGSSFAHKEDGSSGCANE